MTNIQALVRILMFSVTIGLTLGCADFEFKSAHQSNFEGLSSRNRTPAAEAQSASQPQSQPARQTETPTALPARVTSTTIADSLPQKNPNKQEVEATSGSAATPVVVVTPKTSIEQSNASLDDKSEACAQIFTGATQSSAKKSCRAAFRSEEKFSNLSLSQIQACAGTEPDSRRTVGCLVGAASRLLEPNDFKTKRDLCTNVYSGQREMDLYLMESCLAGIFMTKDAQPAGPGSTCSSISKDPSFVAACSVGASFQSDLAAKKTPAELATHAELCHHYFDTGNFHSGYRSCVLAEGFKDVLDQSYRTVAQRCHDLTGHNNEAERAACLIGAMLIHSSKHPKRILACGTDQIAYDDKRGLGCMTAVSLLEFASAKTAHTACQEVFHSRRSKARKACQQYVSQLSR